MIKGVRNMADRKFKNVEDLRKDNFNRVMSEVDVHESIMAIIKYYGDCRKAIKDLHDRGINVTEDQLYHLKCGTHRAAIEKFMPLSEFRKLKERKIRIVCESLVRNNGSVMDTFRELKPVIPFIRYYTKKNVQIYLMNTSIRISIRNRSIVNLDLYYMNHLLVQMRNGESSNIRTSKKICMKYLTMDVYGILLLVKMLH